MTEPAHFTADQAREAGEAIGIDWSVAPFDVEQFRAGMDVELEHGDARSGHRRDRLGPRRHRQDRARPPQRVPRLLHPPRPDGGRGRGPLGRAGGAGLVSRRGVR